MQSNDLQTVIDRTPKSDTILVLGDANANSGRKVYMGESEGNILGSGKRSLRRSKLSTRKFSS